MRKNLVRILFGLGILALAVVAIGRAFGFWDIAVFDGWWTLFIIIPALASMISSRPNFGNIFLLCLGLWLWARCQEWIKFPFDLNYLALAVFLVLVALWLIFGREHWRGHDGDYDYNVNCSAGSANVGGSQPDGKSEPIVNQTETNYDDSNVSYNDKPSYLGIFGTTIATNRSTQLKKCEAVAVFGRVEVDLSQAMLESNKVTFSAVNVFGGIDIVPPANTNVVVKGVPIFGGCEKMRGFSSNDPSMPTIVIDYVSIFGGIRVK